MPAPARPEETMTEEEIDNLRSAWTEFGAASDARHAEFVANNGLCAPPTQARVFLAERALMRLTDYSRLVATLDAYRAREERLRGALEKISAEIGALPAVGVSLVSADRVLTVCHTLADNALKAPPDA